MTNLLRTRLIMGAAGALLLVSVGRPASGPEDNPKPAKTDKKAPEAKEEAVPEKADEAKLGQQLDVVVMGRRPCHVEAVGLISQHARKEVAQAAAEHGIRGKQTDRVFRDRPSAFRGIGGAKASELLHERQRRQDQ